MKPNKLFNCKPEAQVHVKEFDSNALYPKQYKWTKCDAEFIFDQDIVQSDLIPSDLPLVCSTDSDHSKVRMDKKKSEMQRLLTIDGSDLLDIDSTLENLHLSLITTSDTKKHQYQGKLLLKLKS